MTLFFGATSMWILTQFDLSGSCRSAGEIKVTYRSEGRKLRNRYIETLVQAKEPLLVYLSALRTFAPFSVHWDTVHEIHVATSRNVMHQAHALWKK